MRRIGMVLHVSRSKSLILRAESIPRFGQEVVDSKLRPVGKVSDVFGPVKRPYIAVKPSVSNPESLVGKPLYVIPPRKRRSGFGRGSVYG